MLKMRVEDSIVGAKLVRPETWVDSESPRFGAFVDALTNPVQSWHEQKRTARCVLPRLATIGGCKTIGLDLFRVVQIHTELVLCVASDVNVVRCSTSQFWSTAAC